MPCVRNRNPSPKPATPLPAVLSVNLGAEGHHALLRRQRLRLARRVDDGTRVPLPLVRHARRRSALGIACCLQDLTKLERAWATNIQAQLSPLPSPPSSPQDTRRTWSTCRAVLVTAGPGAAVRIVEIHGSLYRGKIQETVGKGGMH